MDIVEVVDRFSGEVQLPLELRDKRRYHVFGSICESGGVFLGGREYGFLDLRTRMSDGEIDRCIYEGRHPLLEDDPFRDELRLNLDRSSGKLRRTDFNEAPFLGYDPLEEETPSAMDFFRLPSPEVIAVSLRRFEQGNGE